MIISLHALIGLVHVRLVVGGSATSARNVLRLDAHRFKPCAQGSCTMNGGELDGAHLVFVKWLVSIRWTFTVGVSSGF
jgi:hypothetical protein